MINERSQSQIALNIVLAVDTYPPVTKAGGIQMRDLAVALAQDGHRVTVLTPDPSVSDTEVELDRGCTIVRSRSGNTKEINLARRAINEFLLSARLWRAFRSNSGSTDGVDVFIWYSPTIFFGPLAYLMRWRYAAATYLVLRDIFPDWALEAGVLKKGAAYYGFKLFERIQYKAADCIGIQSENNRSYFSNSKLRTRVQVLHNWRELETPATGYPEAFAPYGLVGKRVLIFGGTLGVAQDLDNLLRLARRLMIRPDIAILILGAGPEKKRLVAEVSAQALTNVEFGDSLPEAAFESLLTVCLGGLITLDRRLTSHNVPGKLLSYLKAGLPVVASVNPGNDLIDLINEAEIGRAVVNGDDEGFAAGVLRLCDDPDARARWSRNTRTLARNRFSARAAARQVDQAIAPFIRKDKKPFGS